MDFSTEVGGDGNKDLSRHLCFLFVFFEFQMCLVGTQYIYDVYIYIYTHIIHIMYIHDMILFVYIYIFSQHSELLDH